MLLAAATSSQLFYNNPQLACVPEQWPAKDGDGDAIRNGKALFSCYSTMGMCEQLATGIASEPSCANLCATPYKCTDHKCVPTAGGGSKEDCEAVCK